MSNWQNTSEICLGLICCGRVCCCDVISFRSTCLAGSGLVQRSGSVICGGMDGIGQQSSEKNQSKYELL